MKHLCVDHTNRRQFVYLPVHCRKVIVFADVLYFCSFLVALISGPPSKRFKRLQEPSLRGSSHELTNSEAQKQKKYQNIQQRGFASGHPPDY
jgi:hypothetical protein